MKVHVLYFARLREVFGRSSEDIEVTPNPTSVATLIEALRERGSPWSEELSPGRTFRVAVDQDMATLATPLRPGAEVAIFPPVTGG